MPSASIFQPAPCQRVSSHRKVWAENTSQNGWCNKVCNRVWQIFRVRPAFLPGKADPYCPETGRTSFLTLGLRKAEPDSRTLRSLPGLISGSVARGCGTPPDGYGARRDFVSLPLFSLSFSGSIAGICKSPKRSACPDRKPSVADRKIVAFGCRIGPEYRLLSGRSGSRPAPEPPPRRSPAEASYSVRTDTAIIYLIMRRAYPPRGCDISQPRLEAHRPCLRPFPATRPPPTEGSSRAKAGTSGHMIRNGDGLRVVSEINVRFPFSARRGRPLRAA